MISFRHFAELKGNFDCHWINNGRIFIYHKLVGWSSEWDSTFLMEWLPSQLPPILKLAVYLKPNFSDFSIVEVVSGCKFGGFLTTEYALLDSSYRIFSLLQLLFQLKCGNNLWLTG